MRKLFTYLKIPCARCQHENRPDSDYCAHCGLMLGRPNGSQYDAVLTQQRWQLADDEVAFFFAVQAVDKLAKNQLQIPVQARAFILQNQQSMELFAGDYDSASLRAKTKHFNPDQPLVILITRAAPIALHFQFDNLHTSEFLAMRASCLLYIKIDQITTFIEYFTAAPGSIKAVQLQKLFAATVKQSVQAWLSTQSLRQLQDQADLAAQLDAHVLADVNLRLAHHGFTATQATIQELRHEKLSGDREKLSEQDISTALKLEAQRAQLEHAKTADTLYSEREWQKIGKQEEQVKLRYRHEEMRQQFGKDLGWLYLQGAHDKAKKRLARAKLQQEEATRLQTLRLAELDRYQQIAEAHTRKQAVQQDTLETTRALEHQAKQKAEERQNEADQWLHSRTLARIKMRSESELSQLQCKQAAQELQQQTEQKIAQQNQKLQLEHELARDHARSTAQHEKLMRTLEVHQHLTQQEQEKTMKSVQVEQSRMRIAQEEEQRRWQRQQQSKAAEQQQQLAIMKMELARLNAIANFSETGKIATVEAANAAALADVLKLQTQVSMSAEQILATQAGQSTHAAQAMSAMAQIQQGMSLEQAMGMLQERLRDEREQREADLKRRHELDLSIAQTWGQQRAHSSLNGRK